MRCWAGLSLSCETDNLNESLFGVKENYLKFWIRGLYDSVRLWITAEYRLAASNQYDRFAVQVQLMLNSSPTLSGKVLHQPADGLGIPPGYGSPPTTVLR